MAMRKTPSIVSEPNAGTRRGVFPEPSEPKASSGMSASPTARDPQRPNILWIAVHDLGTRLGCYGFDSVQSPNLDGLAETGVRFTRCFAAAPFCSPSRGAMITGKYPHVNGLMGNVNLGWNWDPNNLTLAQALGASGYATFLMGYQHEVRPDRLQDLGFQHTEDPKLGNRCRSVAPRVARFLRERAGEAQPFYLRTGFFEVHRPCDGYAPEDPSRVSLPPWLKDTPGAREDLAQYDGCIRDMDKAVGEILHALDESGLADNTLVLFVSDHGSPFPRAKSTLYDPGINVALLMRWPRGFSGRRARDEMIANVDLFPTILEAAGAAVPDDIQGRSFLPLLRGEAYEPRSDIFCGTNVYDNDTKRAIRTERYKYIHNLMPGPAVLLADAESGLSRRDYGNDHCRPRPEFELYDLHVDPLEQTNLAGRQAFETVERELADRLRRIRTDTRDPYLDGSFRRPPEEHALLVEASRIEEQQSKFPRDGLLNASRESLRDDWRFAPLPQDEATTEGHGSDPSKGRT